MKKAVLISIKPEWVCKIINGEKTIEVRKTSPKCELPVEVYIYCTKGKRTLRRNVINGHSDFYINKGYGDVDLNGKIVAKFTLRKVEKFLEGGTAIPLYTDCEIMRKACVSLDELDEYGNKSRCNGDPTLYAYHISDLVIFDKPKELSEFEYLNPSGIVTVSQRSLRGLPKRPPQSWGYVEEIK